MDIFLLLQFFELKLSRVPASPPLSLGFSFFFQPPHRGLLVSCSFGGARAIVGEDICGYVSPVCDGVEHWM